MSHVLGTIASTTDLDTVYPLKGFNEVISYTIGGGGSAIVAGEQGSLIVPYACVPVSWTLLAVDPAVTAGAIVIDIWASTYAGFPPVVGGSITGTVQTTASPAGLTTTVTGTDGVINWVMTFTSGILTDYTVVG